MRSERAILKEERARYKEQVTSLKHYLRELKRQCVDCDAAQEHIDPDIIKAEHDIQFYESRIKEFGSRLKTLNDAAASAKKQ